MVIPSTPALHLLAFTRRHASLRFSRSHTSSIHRLVLAGLWGPCVAASDSVSSLPASRASPADVDEKSSSIWMFCCLSLSRLMSYSPLQRRRLPALLDYARLHRFAAPKGAGRSLPLWPVSSAQAFAKAQGLYSRSRRRCPW